MRVRFDQVRADVGVGLTDVEIAGAADSIIVAHRTLLVASAVGAGGSACNAIVADYGRALKGVLIGLIRQSALYDAEVLPFDKETIKSALLDCAKQQEWSEAEVASLGDLYFYTSFFIVGLTERESEAGCHLAEEQRAEGLALRAQWQSATTSRKQSRFSLFLTSWLKH